MKFMQFLMDFLARKFPFWGVCHFHFEPETRTMFVQCFTSGKIAKIVAESQMILDLDIGIKQFVIKSQFDADIVISPIRAAKT